MKQHITVEQYMELSKEGAERLYRWRRDGRNYDNLLSIGQMVEFLDEEREIKIKREDPFMSNEWQYINECGLIDFHNAKKLCDNLWEAVKEVLNG